MTARAALTDDLSRALDAAVAHNAVERVPARLIRRMVEAGVSQVPRFEPLENRGQDSLRRFVEAGGRVALGNDAAEVCQRIAKLGTSCNPSLAWQVNASERA